MLETPYNIYVPIKFEIHQNVDTSNIFKNQIHLKSGHHQHLSSIFHPFSSIFSGSSPAPSDRDPRSPWVMARPQSQQLPQRPPAEPRAQTSDGARERSPSPHTEPLGGGLGLAVGVFGIPKNHHFWGDLTVAHQMMG